MNKKKILIISLIIVVIIGIIIWYIKMDSEKNKIKEEDAFVEASISETNFTETDNLKEIRYIDRFFIKMFYYRMNNVDILDICAEYKELPERVESFRINKLYYIFYYYCVDITINEENYYFLLMQDMDKRIYELKKVSKEEFEKEINGEPLKSKYINYEIKSRKFNSINITEETEARYYLSIFNKTFINSAEEAYELLDTDYKEKRFKDLESFKRFVETYNVYAKSSDLYKINKINETEEFIEYDILDNYGRNFIIKANNNHEFSVILDDYTIKGNAEKYKELSADKKAEYALEAIEKMINMRDYDLLYNLLDENFKNSVFENKDKFVEYMINNIERLVSFKEEKLRSDISQIYIYKVEFSPIIPIRENVITEYSNKDMDIIIRLVDEENFTFSFSINS